MNIKHTMAVYSIDYNEYNGDRDDEGGKTSSCQ